ncbi:uncharacterized protein N7515_000977 [Penicillium bovifimosum]|uniref:Uncharacterized protein n=1 Tax=Penicillium bovifimosum TaxID=126998 RepID=A0A9W9HGU9_9EURO|nr:uncharacterized protein N7515_000977 [Penicillium bovifimosum]KAJ5146413.1 hypothetical protein N7515_000977 [Penicillium bovifimosum]
MTQAAQMQQPAQSMHSMFPSDNGNLNNMSSESHVGSYQALDPAQDSLEDYNRSMLQYTQRQMSSFVDVDDSHPGRGSSGRSSQSSGQSGRSSASSGTDMASQANGPSPASGSAVSGRDMAEA